MINKIIKPSYSKSMITTLLIIFSFYSSNTYAQDCMRAMPILTGELSKCDGILYPESLVKEHLLLRLKTEELAQKLKVTKENCHKKILICEKYIANADMKIDRLNNPPFWKTPIFNFCSGIVIAIVSVFSISNIVR